MKGLGPGGAERLLVELAKVLDRDEVEVTCAYVLPWKDHLTGELEAAGVRCVCLSRTRNDLRWPLRLRALLKTGFDVVHVHSPLPGSVARLAARTIRDAPQFVATEHNAWPTFARPTRVLNRWTSGSDAVTFAVSDEVRASITGAAASRAQTLQHGIDVAATARAAERREQLRVELGLIPRELALVTVANLRAQKDYPNLLQAAALLRDRGVPFRLVAVGQGPLAEDIRQLRDGLALQEHVILTGFRPDATAVLGACDVFVLASAWEGLPVAVMEALALGKPIVATAVGGVAEALRDEETALLVPPRDARALADALERVLTDAALRARLADASRIRAADFDVRECARVQLDTYARLAPAADRATETKSATPRRTSRDFEIREATAEDRPAMLALLGRSLGWGDDDRYARFYAWKHDENPFGPSPAWVAVDGDRLLGLRVFLRWEFVRGGSVVRAVRAVDTATDPDAQGRGIFRALTMHAVEAMTADGVSMVFNTPNAQSRPGYLKMGWRDLGRYPVSVRVASPSAALRVVRAKVPADKWSTSLHAGADAATWMHDNAITLNFDHPDDDVRTIRTNTSLPFLQWRYGSDLLGYRVLEHDGAAALVRARRRGAATELTTVFTLRGTPGQGDGAVARSLEETGADYAIRTGPANVRNGFVPLPNAGPMLTWRALADRGMPPLANWNLTLGDLELM